MHFRNNMTDIFYEINLLNRHVSMLRSKWFPYYLFPERKQKGSSGGGFILFNFFLFPSKITLFRPPTLEGMTSGAWPKCCSKCSSLQVEQVEARINWGQKKASQLQAMLSKSWCVESSFYLRKKTCFSCLILCKSRKSKSDDIIISWWLRIK